MESWQYRGNSEFQVQKGEFTVESPSNIALTKYWGKHGNQLPRNPSISFTLSHAKTTTKLGFTRAEGSPGGTIKLYFEGHKNEDFERRIENFFYKNQEHFPYFNQCHWVIESQNSFPHSSGIASSASSMSALMWAFCQVEQEHLQCDYSEEQLRKRASFLSRLASGSASRSIFPQAALWGHHPDIKESSDLYAIPMAHILHPEFQNYHDDILIVSREEKSVSSSAGHQLMKNNPFAELRFSQASRHTLSMVDILQKGDVHAFVELVEQEALTLHALMMTSNPSYVLMKPATLQIIQAVRDFRHESGIPLCFTLDAGPNVHLLYPDRHSDTCQNFIQDYLLSLAVDQNLLKDQLGKGARTI